MVRIVFAMLGGLLLTCWSRGVEPDPPKQDPVSAASALRGNEILAGYVKARERIDRYACGMFVEVTDEDLADTGASTFSGNWYFHSFDRERKCHRQDEAIYYEFDDTVRPLTLFANDKEVIQTTIDANLERTVVQLEGATPEDWQRLRHQRYFVPFDLPLLGRAGFFQRKMTFPKANVIKTMAKRFRVTKFQETLDAVVCEYQVLSKYPMFNRIVFDRRAGMMPTRVDTIIREKRYSGKVYATEIKWKSFGKLWYPHQIDIRAVRGNPQAPSSISNYQIDFYWVFDDNVPSSVFSPTDAITTVELKERILEFATNR